MTLPEVAKLIRADIKAANLPKGIKVKVHTRTRGTHAIDVQIVEFPGPVLNPANVYADAAGIWQDRRSARWARAVRAALETLEAIMQAYNRDTSDIQSDYFNCKFYGHAEVQIDCRAERAALLAGDALADLKIAKSAGVDCQAMLAGYEA